MARNHQENLTHRVVVLAGSFGALGIVRDLGKQGIHSIVMGRAEYVGRSRYCTFIKTSTMQGMLHKLLKLPIDSKEKLILLTDNDMYMEMIYSHWDELSLNYLVASDPANEILTDKTRLHDAAAKVGIPVPATYSGLQQLGIHHFPVIVKPVQRDVLWQHSAIKREKAYECHSRDELEVVLRMMQSVNVESITQEIIEGDLENLHCVTLYRNRCGNVLVGDVVQKLGQFPADYGTGTALKTENHPKLVDYSIRLLTSAGYIGVAMIEYKYCSATDDYYVIEVNGRFPAFAGIMGKIGNRFAFRIYSDLASSERVPADEHLSRQRYETLRKPVVWLYLLNDARWNASRSLLKVVKPMTYFWKYKIQPAAWDWRDPVPCFHYYMRLLQPLVTQRKTFVQTTELDDSAVLSSVSTSEVR